MSEIKKIDKVCACCGVLMANVVPMQKYCKPCADRRKKISAAKYKAEKRRKDMTRAKADNVPNLNERFCRGCIYWYGHSSSCNSCNYIFVEGHRRPCPPGKRCTVRKKKK